MKKSKYANSNGVCTAKECKEVLLIMDVRAADKRMLPVVLAGAAKLGITFTVRQVNGAYPVIQTPSKNMPISTRPRWGKDYADPSTFIDPLFNTQHPAERQHELLARRADPGGGEEAGDHGEHQQRPEHRGWPKACASTVGDVRPRATPAIDRKLTTQIVPWSRTSGETRSTSSPRT